jgi:hypothetical protein
VSPLRESSTKFIFLAGIAGFIAIMLSIAFNAVWHDELFTLYVTRPDIGLDFALREYWLQDNHPPLFYFLSWATNSLGDSAEPRRLINAAAFVAYFAIIVWIWRTGLATPTVLALYLLIVISAGSFAASAGDLRSYFFSLIFPGIMSLLLIALCHTPDGQLRERSPRTMYGLFAVTAVLRTNLHFITSIVACSLLAVFALRALLERNRIALRWIVGCGAVGVSIFVVLTAIAFPRLESNTRQFWAEPGVWNGFKTLARTGLETALCALPIVALALPCLFTLFRKVLSGDRLDHGERDIVSLFAALALFVVVLLVIQFIRPVIVDYYLVAVVGPAGLLCAIAAARTISHAPPRIGRAVLWLAFLWSLVALAINTYAAIELSPRCRQSSQFVRDAIIACPDTIVHREPAAHRGLSSLAPDENRTVSYLAYHVLAEKYGFTFDPWNSRRVSQTCPTLFWSPYDNEFETAQSALQRLRAKGFAIDRLQRIPLGGGVVFQSSPQAE